MTVHLQVDPGPWRQPASGRQIAAYRADDIGLERGIKEHDVHGPGCPGEEPDGIRTHYLCPVTGFQMPYILPQDPRDGGRALHQHGAFGAAGQGLQGKRPAAGKKIQTASAGNHAL